MTYEISFLKALGLTIFIETSVLFFLFEVFFKSLKINRWLLLFTGIVASLATLPYLWFIFPIILKSRFWYIFVSEITAVVVESVIVLGILRINVKKALLISFVCNMVSFLIGLLINWF